MPSLMADSNTERWDNKHPQAPGPLSQPGGTPTARPSIASKRRGVLNGHWPSNSQNRARRSGRRARLMTTTRSNVSERFAMPSIADPFLSSNLSTSPGRAHEKAAFRDRLAYYYPAAKPTAG